MMCHSLYVKANGEMPCWDDIGETLTLRKLDEGTLLDSRELPIFQGTELQQIRQSFIAGRDPHPGLCDLCAVRGHTAIETTLHPRTMEVLHLEASYLCHLSCPQCIPTQERRSLKAPPYNMTPGLVQGLLRQLQREGVEHIRFIHFEGRGDPLVNPLLPELIESCRGHFPKSLIAVTTHCSYPYMPSLVRSELNVLRASIDGATPESYMKYRVGGNFERAIEFLRKLRDDRIRARSALRVEWKYILFEWNDSHSEMQRAVEMAKELQVHLTFMRTHTPGRSLRFRTDEELRQYVRQFAPGSAVEQTFPLRSASEASTSAVIAEHVSALLSLAIERIRAGDHSDALGRLTEALKHDPGISVSGITDIGEIVSKSLSQVLTNAQFPATLTWLAAVSREIGDSATSDTLLSRYLEVAPEAPDRNRILSDRFIRTAVRRAAEKEFDSAHAGLRQALNLELGVVADSAQPGNPILFHLERILTADCSASLAVGFASVALAESYFPEARALFQKYVAIAPEASDRKRVEKIIAEIDDHIQRKDLKPTFWRRAMNLVHRVFS
jgi:wyosine [tRNA(Phe)-imidazoG37] synthetase (radical SAM superfamily)